MRNKLGQFVKGHKVFPEFGFQKGIHPKTEFKKGHQVNKKTPFEIKCKNCDKVFYVRPYKKDTAKYCSQKCRYNHMGNGRKGTHHSEETKRKIGKAQTGEKSHSWKGGKIKNKYGYILVKKRNHPFSNTSGYIMQHKIVMEKHLGRYLNPKEVVHHINNINNDNRIENLKLFKNDSEHQKFHWSSNRKLMKIISSPCFLKRLCKPCRLYLLSLLESCDK